MSNTKWMMAAVLLGVAGIASSADLTSKDLSERNQPSTQYAAESADTAGELYKRIHIESDESIYVGASKRFQVITRCRGGGSYSDSYINVTYSGFSEVMCRSETQEGGARTQDMGSLAFVTTNEPYLNFDFGVGDDNYATILLYK